MVYARSLHQLSRQATTASNGTAVPFPPLPMPQLQKQEQALEKNMSEHPCTGVLCPEDNNMTKLFHAANNTV